MNKVIIAIPLMMIFVLTACSNKPQPSSSKYSESSSEKEYKNQDLINAYDNNGLQVITSINGKDMDGDNLNEEVGLFLNSDLEVVLKVNTSEQIFSKGVSEEELFGDDINNKYTSELHVCGDKVLVGLFFSGTNKYGSTTWLKCYEYKDDQLEVIWSTEDLVHQSAYIKDYDDEQNKIKINIYNHTREMVLNDTEEDEYLAFTEYLKKEGVEKYEMDVPIIPNYTFYDMDRDGDKELILYAIVTFGASSISDRYYMAYDFTSDGLIELDSWFNSSKPEVGTIIEFR